MIGDLSFLWALPSIDTLENDIPEDVLDLLCVKLETAVYENHQLLALLKEFSVQNNLKFGPFMKTLRAHLSGMQNGPKVGEMMEILDSKIVIERLQRGRGKRRNANTNIKKSTTM